MADMDIRTAKSAPEKKSSSNRRFEIAKTGIIGLQRDTMLENELHLLVKLLLISFRNLN